MQIETLKLYCDVVRLRSISRGGALSGVTQSAASQAIQQLETDLDVQLLDRSRRPLQPTQEGRGFYEACRTLLADFDRARAELATSRQRVEGTVRVAAIYSVGLHDMSRHMQPFMAMYPNARVLLECLHPHKVVEAVLGDEADLGILSYPPANRALEVLPAPRGAHGARLPPEPPARAAAGPRRRPTSRASGSWPSTTTCRSAGPSTASSARRACASRWSCSSTTSRRSSRRSPSPPA